MLCSSLDGRDRRREQVSGPTLKALGPEERDGGMGQGNKLIP